MTMTNRDLAALRPVQVANPNRDRAPLLVALEARPLVACLLLALATVAGTGGCGGGEAAGDDETMAEDDETTAGGERADADLADDDGDEADAEDALAEDEADDDASDEDDAESAAVDEADEGPDPRVVWRRKVRRGRRVFERVCGVCHPGGEEDLGPRIIGRRLSVSTVRRQIRQGVGRMRAIPPSKLPERYMDELFAYLSTIRTVRGVRRPR